MISSGSTDLVMRICVTAVLRARKQTAGREVHKSLLRSSQLVELEGVFVDQQKITLGFCVHFFMNLNPFPALLHVCEKVA